MLTTIIDPRLIFDALWTPSRLLLCNLPVDQYGLYGLYDHHGQIRYVGETADEDGYYGRINNRHVTGSEGRSHQYANEYIPLKTRLVAPGFVRTHCRATIFPIPGRPPLGTHTADPGLRTYKARLRTLESETVELFRARGFALDWNK
jgi:hypothetical protein